MLIGQTEAFAKWDCWNGLVVAKGQHLPATASFAEFVTTWPWLTSARVRDAEGCDPCALLQAAGASAAQTAVEFRCGMQLWVSS